MDELEREAVRDRLREQIRANGGPAGVARRVGRSKRVVQRWLQRGAPLPNTEGLRALQQAGVSVGWVLNGGDEPGTMADMVRMEADYFLRLEGMPLHRRRAVLEAITAEPGRVASGIGGLYARVALEIDRQALEVAEAAGKDFDQVLRSNVCEQAHNATTAVLTGSITFNAKPRRVAGDPDPLLVLPPYRRRRQNG